MNTVWIVLKNGKVDEVFSDEVAAAHHAKQLNKKWSLTEVVEREVKAI